MNTSELLKRCHDHTSAAHALTADLLEAAQAGTGLPVEQVRPPITELLAHLQQASAAARALDHVAAGLKPPKLGD